MFVKTKTKCIDILTTQIGITQYDGQKVQGVQYGLVFFSNQNLPTKPLPAMRGNGGSLWDFRCIRF